MARRASFRISAFDRKAEIQTLEHIATKRSSNYAALPMLGVAGNSAIMSLEPVFALALPWLILGQTIEPVQLAGALLVVDAVMVLGLSKSR